VFSLLRNPEHALKAINRTILIYLAKRTYRAGPFFIMLQGEFQSHTARFEPCHRPVDAFLSSQWMNPFYGFMN